MIKECIYCDQVFEYSDKDVLKVYFEKSKSNMIKKVLTNSSAVVCKHCKSLLEV